MRYLILATIGMFLASEFAAAQLPGRGGRGGRGGGERGGRGGGERGGRGGPGGFSRGGQFDPNQFFDFLSGGKDVIVRDELDGFKQRIFDRIADRMNITSGRITRGQFVKAFEKLKKEREQRMAEGEDYKARAESYFRRYDRNRDGYLTPPDEMSRTLQGQWQKWDFNKDKKIDLRECTAYIKNYYEERDRGRGDSPRVVTAPGNEKKKDEEADRPVVWYFGNLPPEIPEWFTTLDSDKDGQIGLYEWRKDKGKTIQRFREIDRNADFLMTPEEAMDKLNAEKGTDEKSGSDSRRRDSRRRSRRR